MHAVCKWYYTVLQDWVLVIKLQKQNHLLCSMNRKVTIWEPLNKLGNNSYKVSLAKIYWMWFPDGVKNENIGMNNYTSSKKHVDTFAACHKKHPSSSDRKMHFSFLYFSLIYLRSIVKLFVTSYVNHLPLPILGRMHPHEGMNKTWAGSQYRC